MQRLLIQHDGKTLGTAEWSRLTGLTQATIRHRIIDLGWSPSDALTRPKSLSKGGMGMDRITKSTAVAELNDTPFTDLPSKFQDLLNSIGYVGAKYGRAIKMNFPKEFDDWFFSTYVPSKRK
jgi:hypothetical protein